jgi:nucleoside 2-deoxyribosyltransferase
MKRVYLAGDLVFRPDALALFDRLRAICAEAGLIGVAPLDGQADLQGLPPGQATIMAIVAADRALMDTCDGGLFCLDPFRRAADMDPGTAVEIGYMLAQGKPMSGYTVDGRDYPEKVAAYFRAAWNQGLRPRPPLALGGASGSAEDPDGMLVHSEGMVQNGMTEGFIRLSGGQVFVNADLGTGFRKAARHLAARFTRLAAAPAG